MDAGRLNELVTIEQKQEAATGLRGQAKYQWVTFVQAYAEIVATTGQKEVVGKQLEEHQEYTVTMRYVTGLTPQMRIVDSAGQTYNIASVDKVVGERRYFWHVLRCTSQKAGMQ